MPEIDHDTLKVEIETYQRLKRNGYIESANKLLESIEKELAIFKESDPNKYNEFSAQLAQ